MFCGSVSVSGVLFEGQEFLPECGTAGPGAHRDVLPSPGAACGNGPCPEGFYSSPDCTLLVKKSPKGCKKKNKWIKKLQHNGDMIHITCD